MIDKALADGAQKPLWVNTEEKLSKSNQYKKSIKKWLEDFGTLEWNEMGMMLEIDRVEVDSAYLRQKYQEDMNRDIPKEAFTDIIVYLAKEASYHPFKEYLDNLPPYEGDPLETWDKLMKAYGLSEKTPYIQMEQLKKHLISAVARTYDPGCKMDNVVVLKGGQGCRKTSSFEALYGRKNFQTLGSHGKEADELLSMYRSVCIEYGEIECTFDKKGQSALKGFLTKTTDTFRAPYAAAPLTIRRNFVLVGTTNESDFLADKTGNRRYWVIDITQKIDIKSIEANRDEFWSLAKSLYFAGIKGEDEEGFPIYEDFLWWFSDEEEAEVAANTASSEQIDSWEDEIFNFMDNRKYATIKELREILGAQNSTLVDRRISSILRKIGATQPTNAFRIVAGGAKARYWSYEKATHEIAKEESF
jgi:predicted P-loop ATPase